MRALIVDDSPAMRVFIKRVLELSGLNIESIAEAANGREALDVLKNGSLDLVLCDVNMPEIDGEQMLEAMNKARLLENICVVVVSTDATSRRVERMLELGARGYLKKPFSPEGMRDTVDRALGSAYA